MEGEKVFVALPELFVFSHVSFFLFFYVMFAEDVFNLILCWISFRFWFLEWLDWFLKIRVFLLFWQRDFREPSTIISIALQDREPLDRTRLLFYYLLYSIIITTTLKDGDPLTGCFIFIWGYFQYFVWGRGCCGLLLWHLYSWMIEGWEWNLTGYCFVYVRLDRVPVGKVWFVCDTWSMVYVQVSHHPLFKINASSTSRLPVHFKVLHSTIRRHHILLFGDHKHPSHHHLRDNFPV